MNGKLWHFHLMDQKKNKFYKLIKKMVSLNQDGTFSLDQNYFKQHIIVMPNFYTEKFDEMNILKKKLKI